MGVAAIALALSVAAACDGKSARAVTYDDCVLEHSKNASSTSVLDAIKVSCKQKHPKAFDFVEIAKAANVPTWPEVAAKREYITLRNTDREATRNAYFDDVLRPRVHPDFISEATTQFESFARGIDNVGSKLGSHTAQTDHVVALPGCPTPVKLRVPAEFVLASAPAAQRLRDTIIQSLHQNPYRKARYSEVFMQDWSNPHGLPQITVASLGSLINVQGQITGAQWSTLKREFLQTSEPQRDALLRKYVAHLSKGEPPEIKMLRTELAGLFEERDDSLVILATSKAKINDTDLDFLTAAKMTYTRGCVAYVTVAVDANAADALAKLNQYVSLVRVQ